MSTSGRYRGRPMLDALGQDPLESVDNEDPSDLRVGDERDCEVLRLSTGPDGLEVALPARRGELGATWDGNGTNFAVYASKASSVSVVLVNKKGEQRELVLPEHRNHIWRGYVPGVRPGQRYGLRVDGTLDPDRGLRHDRSKLLLDPYARAVDRNLLGVVVDGRFDWRGDLPVHERKTPLVANARRVIYETHVRSLTQRHPGIPETLRGTYVGMGHPVVIDHLVRLGITSVEVMPVQAFTESYWGYSPIGYFAVHPNYALATNPQEQVREFKEMVRAYHDRGIEVLIDVVYNHTAEGNHEGPTLSFRGIDNETYYALVPGQPQYYWDSTGCGNTLNIADPMVNKLVMDSLRYWVTEMHVDGFRFDEGPSLSRYKGITFHKWSNFHCSLIEDPILSAAKLIFEPWDCGKDYDHVGDFPPGTYEWNDRFRNEVRDFWRGESRGVGQLALRVAGSQDIYGTEDRGPLASVNIVVCHDGYTARDWASYERKHNEANGEANSDGNKDNRSCNYGVEGDFTPDGALVPAEIRELRLRQQRNLLATPFLSLGTPMMLGGDELNRTQKGNNNPYNQDNETNYFDWEADDAGMNEFLARVIAFRAANPTLQRSTFLRGRSFASHDNPDCLWLRPDGVEMQKFDWEDGSRRSLGLLLNGDAIGERWPTGLEKSGDTILILRHSGAWDMDWRLPDGRGNWEVAIDTAAPHEADGVRKFAAGDVLKMTNRSTVVLRRV